MKNKFYFCRPFLKKYTFNKMLTTFVRLVVSLKIIVPVHAS